MHLSVFSPSVFRNGIHRAIFSGFFKVVFLPLGPTNIRFMTGS